MLKKRELIVNFDLQEDKQKSTISEEEKGSLRKNSDNKWHEDQITTSTVLRNKIDEYICSFTLHGLSKIFKASTKVESLFWFLMLSSAIALSLYVGEGLITKYFKYEVYSDVKLVITEKNYFPAITVCEKEMLYELYYSYCGHLDTVGQQQKGHQCSIETTLLPREHNVVVTTDNATWWSNGIFNVTKCLSWGAKKCTKSHYLKSLAKYKHACFVWNYHGNLYDAYSHIDFEFSFVNATKTNGKQPDVILMAHDPLDLEIDLTKMISLEPKIYDISFEKTIVKRLGHPFPSDCTTTKSNDMYPGKYSRKNCIQSLYYTSMYKKCGDTMDYARNYIPHDVLVAYAQNRTVKELRACIERFVFEDSSYSTMHCPFPCQELELNSLVSSRQYFENDARRARGTIAMGIQYAIIDSYRLVQEKQLYSKYQLACEIGGMVGLLLGFSLLSGVEIVVCLFMWITNIFTKKS